MNNLDNLVNLLPNNCDCAIVYSDNNRFYLTGFSSSYGILVITRQKSYLLIDFRYYERAFSSVKSAEVVLLKNEYNQLKEILNKHNCKNISIESNYVTLQKFIDLKNKLSGFNLLNSNSISDLLDHLKSIKSQDEISKISAAQAITELAFEHILGFISEGRTEKEIAIEINNFIFKRADNISFDTIVVSGSNSSFPHAKPSDKQLQDGDFVTLDFGAKLNGYNSDMSRTVCIGEPCEEQLLVYKNVLFAQNMALDYLKEGQNAKDIDKLVREYFKSQDFHNAFGHSLGHGVGTKIHESPILSPSSEAILKQGMVITIEPGLYFPGKFGVRIEDLVVVLEDGCKNLTTASKEIIIL